MRTPQKTAWRSNTIAEEPEEGDEEASGSGARPQALSASACQQVRPLPRPTSACCTQFALLKASAVHNSVSVWTHVLQSWCILSYTLTLWQH